MNRLTRAIIAPARETQFFADGGRCRGIFPSLAGSALFGRSSSDYHILSAGPDFASSGGEFCRFFPSLVNQLAPLTARALLMLEYLRLFCSPVGTAIHQGEGLCFRPPQK